MSTSARPAGIRVTLLAPAAPAISPGTLATALDAERSGLGSVRFAAGRAYWVPEGPRFPVPVVEAGSGEGTTP